MINKKNLIAATVEKMFKKIQIFPQLFQNKNRSTAQKSSTSKKRWAFVGISSSYT